VFTLSKRHNKVLRQYSDNISDLTSLQLRGLARATPLNENRHDALLMRKAKTIVGLLSYARRGERDYIPQPAEWEGGIALQVLQQDVYVILVYMNSKHTWEKSVLSILRQKVFL
jgi:hypothetical protein